MDWNRTAEIIRMVMPFLLAIVVLIGGALGFRDPKRITHGLDPDDVPDLFNKKKKDNAKKAETTADNEEDHTDEGGSCI